MFKDIIFTVSRWTCLLGHVVFGSSILPDIAQIHLFIGDEKKHDDMRSQYHSVKVDFYIDRSSYIKSCTTEIYKVDNVLHLFAIRVLPLFEFFPLKSVNTSAFVTDIVQISMLYNSDKMLWIILSVIDYVKKVVWWNK